MSKQKRPDTYDSEIPETPKHLSKRKKKPKKKKAAPKEFTCPFCEKPFKLRSDCYHYWGSEHPRNFKCKNCGAGPWGYMQEVPDILKRWSRDERRWLEIMGTREEWRAENCPFCEINAHFIGCKDHSFMLWASPEDDVYCCKCNFRGKIGGKRK